MKININEIEILTESQAKEMALETMEYKGYTIYFVRFDDEHFKYSKLVFKNNRHIYYANDYELHHSSHTEEAIREFYIDSLKTTLYEDKDMDEVKDYQDYELKSRWLSNLVPQERDYLSMFFIHTTEEEEREFEKYQKANYPLFNPVGHCYNKAEDKDFIQHCVQLHVNLNGANKKRREQDNDYMEKAFLKEMLNHEYCYNWQGDYDVCSCFGQCEFEEGKTYHEYLTEMNKEKWIPLFENAKREYEKSVEY